MPDSGYNWPATGTHFQVAGVDVDGTLVNDGAAITCDALSLDVKASCGISVEAIEDNTGACDGNVYVSILQCDLDPDAEGYQVGPTTGPVFTDPVWTPLVLDPVQNTTRKGNCAVSGGQISKFKLHVLNDSGQQLAITANYGMTTIPAAS